MAPRPSTPATQKSAVRKHCDFAYVMQGDDHARSVKIGRTGSPNQRLSTLIAGVPFRARLIAVMSEGVRREREMKAALSAHRLRGEWYSPSTELNAFLATVRANNGILTKIEITAAFFDDHIRPQILSHLNGRDPTFTDGGDFVYRVLREGLPAAKGRLHSLITACPGLVTPELAAGFVPLSFDAPLPQVEVVAAAPAEKQVA